MNDDIMRAAVSAAGYELHGESRSFSAQGIDVSWEDIDEANEVMIWCTVGDMPEDPKVEFMRYLLKANCFGSGTAGGHLGLYSLAHALIYSYRLLLDEDYDVTARVLQAFVSKALQFTGKVNELQTSTAVGAEEDKALDSGIEMMQMSSLRI